MDNLYNRQKDLPLNLPPHVVVAGVGGVGSWLALGFALSGVPRLTLIDYDSVEESNLNRTPFKTIHVGLLKVVAMQDLISERRPSCKVEVLPGRAEDIADLIKWQEGSLFFDMRDRTEPLPGYPQPIITGGYDGSSVTLHFHPRPGSVWGEGDSFYTTTPSWLCPPQLIANIIIAKVLLCSREGEESINTFDIKQLVELLERKEVTIE